MIQNLIGYILAIVTAWAVALVKTDNKKVETARNILKRSIEINQMMMVIGEEGTSSEDYVTYQKGELLDAAYLQQNSFDPVDANCSTERQRYVTDKLIYVLGSEYEIDNKDVKELLKTLEKELLNEK